MLAGRTFLTVVIWLRCRPRECDEIIPATSGSSFFDERRWLETNFELANNVVSVYALTGVVGFMKTFACDELLTFLNQGLKIGNGNCKSRPCFSRPIERVSNGD